MLAAQLWASRLLVHAQHVQAEKLQLILEQQGPAFLETYRLPLLTYEEGQDLKRSSAPAIEAAGAPAEGAAALSSVLMSTAHLPRQVWGRGAAHPSVTWPDARCMLQAGAPWTAAGCKPSLRSRTQQLAATCSSLQPTVTRRTLMASC